MRSVYAAYADALPTHLALRQVPQRYRPPFLPRHPAAPGDALAGQCATPWCGPAPTRALNVLRDAFPALLAHLDNRTHVGDHRSVSVQ